MLSKRLDILMERGIETAREILKDWWVFTHLCPYMERTFDGTTMEFREVIRAILAGERWVGAPEDALKILTLTGNTEAMPSDSPVPVPTNTVSYEYNAHPICPQGW